MGQRTGRVRARGNRKTASGSERLMRMLLAEAGGASRVLELYYWSREPGMLDIVRAIVAMPEQTRSTLEAFVALAGNPKAIDADLTSRGTLTLTSPEVSRGVALAHYVAANDPDEAHLN